MLDDLLARCRSVDEPWQRQFAAKALYGKIIALGARGLTAEAIGVCEELITRFGTETEPLISKLVATARSWCVPR